MAKPVIVIASQHNNRLQCCLNSLKGDYDIYVMWDGGDKPIDLSGIPARHQHNLRIIFWGEIRRWLIDTYGVSEQAIDIQTTLKKCFYYAYLLSFDIRKFFYTDDDVYFWEDPTYDDDEPCANLVYQVDAFLGASVAGRRFYQDHMPKYSSYFDGVDRYTFPLVGNFYVNLLPHHAAIYNRMMHEFIAEFSLITLWRKASHMCEVGNRNTNIFYIDSFFLDAFFFELMKQSDCVSRKVGDWVILAGCMKMLISGAIRQHKQPKGRILMHYNIYRKAVFFDYFFSKEENVVMVR